ncbi:hypothetical protein [Novosphingobium sp. Leaf2]|uniref:hypothetical protein n=1 Tax=Novosphingobium sp. Leaf2 TaxID=1735670 RepID=UPI0006F1C9A1|nr:hypothetical protein [Novosphingobium sp. Leaf2]KQM21901.1 hypothetical protein ASE49_00880 [Novosphingobium sp. Leaf2]
MSTITAPRRAATLWGAAFFVGMFGTGILARRLDLGAIPSMLVMLPPMLLLIPLVRSSERAQAECGALSAATRRYNRRAMLWSFGYMVLLAVSVIANRQLHPGGPLLWLLAVLPALPILYLIWAMARYLAEEQDEYLRMRVVNAALGATALLLGVATVWGFLETFHVVDHVPGWMAVPVWAVGLGIGSAIGRWRDSR